MSVVADTHAMIWYVEAPQELSPAATAAMGGREHRRLVNIHMKVKDSPKAQTNKTTYMSAEAFAALRKALEAALAFERGKRRMHVTRIRVPR